MRQYSDLQGKSEASRLLEYRVVVIKLAYMLEGAICVFVRRRSLRRASVVCCAIVGPFTSGARGLEWATGGARRYNGR